jgi:hypothetical protein
MGDQRRPESSQRERSRTPVPGSDRSCMWCGDMGCMRDQCYAQDQDFRQGRTETAKAAARASAEAVSRIALKSSDKLPVKEEEACEIATAFVNGLFSNVGGPRRFVIVQQQD